MHVPRLPLHPKMKATHPRSLVAQYLSVIDPLPLSVSLLFSKTEPFLDSKPDRLTLLSSRLVSVRVTMIFCQAGPACTPQAKCRMEV